jgi:hypothetical protein
VTGPSVGPGIGSDGSPGTGHPVDHRPALRRQASDPVVPAVLLIGGALLAAASGTVLTWAVVGGLAGYTLSGSV